MIGLKTLSNEELRMLLSANIEKATAIVEQNKVIIKKLERRIVKMKRIQAICPNCGIITNFEFMTIIGNKVLCECPHCYEEWDYKIQETAPNPIRRIPIIVPKTIYVPPLFALLSTEGTENSEKYISVTQMKKWMDEELSHGFDGEVRHEDIIAYLDAQ